MLDSELGSYFIKAEKLNMHPKKKESQLIVSMKHWFFFNQWIDKLLVKHD